MNDNSTPLILGRVSGIYGIKGWVKILSFTRPKENILRYNSLFINHDGQWQELNLEDSQHRNGRLMIKLSGIDTPEEARNYIGKDLAIDESKLPELPKGQYYWNQLIGLSVYSLDKELLGKIIDILETGANDVLVVKIDDGNTPKLLIPLVIDVFIKEVDLDNRRMIVDWQKEE